MCDYIKLSAGGCLLNAGQTSVKQVRWVTPNGRIGGIGRTSTVPVMVSREVIQIPLKQVLGFNEIS